jgi:hypothetical protein
MEIVKGELGSCTETCVTSSVGRNEVTSVPAERVYGIKEEEDQEPMPIPEIKTEPKVRFMSVVGIHIGCIHSCVPIY